MNDALSPQQLRRSERRVVARLAIGVLLEQIRFGRVGRQPLDTVLVLAIGQANVGHLMREPDAQLAYAGIAELVPDTLRRPISINALASSLRMPFETVRRRVHRLVDDGVCQSSPGGVFLPATLFAGPQQREGLVELYQRVRRFYFDLKALGALHHLPQSGRALEAAPVLIVVRLFSAFMMRVLDAGNARWGDMLDALFVMSLLYLNTDGLTIADLDRSPNGVAPDALRRPVRVSELAAFLVMPPESVRRRVGWLVEREICVRTERGVYLPAAVLLARTRLGWAQEDLAELDRLLLPLAQLGVVEFWEREAAAGAS